MKIDLHELHAVHYFATSLATLAGIVANDQDIPYQALD
jgi:hypothetical protein